jgi:hypothetical protein
MIHTVKNPQDDFLALLAQDPVRPHIPQEQRIGPNREILVYKDEDGAVKAITCVSYLSSVPESETELFDSSTEPDVAVFYTIWSYVAGAGRTLIFEAVRHIQETRPNIHRFVTLSPKTDMARRFHIRNGAVVFRENPETVNYEYVNS